MCDVRGPLLEVFLDAMQGVVAFHELLFFSPLPTRLIFDQLKYRPGTSAEIDHVVDFVLVVSLEDDHVDLDGVQSGLDSTFDSLDDRRHQVDSTKPLVDAAVQSV